MEDLNESNKDLNENTQKENETVENKEELRGNVEDKLENDIFEESDVETFATTEQINDALYKSKSREMFEWVGSIAIALVVALILRNYIVTFVKVDGSSMVPTLINNERLIVVRLLYKPHEGDIIILNPPVGRGPYVKRIIGMPGQTVTIDSITGNVYVDGVLKDEPYINNKTIGSKSEYVVPDKCVFVLGDNRGVSHDSRAPDVGFIPYKSVLGKVVFRVWPFTRFGTIK